MDDRKLNDSGDIWLRQNERSVFTGIYLTLFSVVGGVVLGLIAQSQSRHLSTFVPIDSLSLSCVATIVMAGATLMVLATILTGYVLTVTFLYWSVGSIDVLLSLLLGISICFSAAHTDTPATWMLWLGATGVFGSLSYLRTRYKLSQNEVPPVNMVQKRIDSEEEFRHWLDNEKAYLATTAGVSFLVSIPLIISILMPALRNNITQPKPTIGVATIVILATSVINFWFYPKRFKRRREMFKTSSGDG